MTHINAVKQFSKLSTNYQAVRTITLTAEIKFELRPCVRQLRLTQPLEQNTPSDT